MRTLWPAALLALALVPAAGCSRTDNEPGPGGVTVSEAKALDDAADMLESRDGTADKQAKAEK
ncbi:hypothetical protein CVO77_15800 [Sphingopyxis lindanitolerans]|uniref:Secreted protein n=1 Tax=Sphingopyxis lindanitolerans TaxID=2054227 RepID=A0A2S8B2B9_9SPHN|nr:hypothetical protein [Sphingopyxis lindanitolerans]PQM26490.1 hypothetical protein CVO77_15800 [Sphingopyxis lindanitolerans]